jgi:hypothetical protein
MDDTYGIEEADDILLDAFNAEIRSLTEAGAMVPISLDPAEAFTLMSLLQLALRHPAIVGFPQAFGRHLAKEIEKRFAELPAVSEIARRGWEIGKTTEVM